MSKRPEKGRKPRSGVRSLVGYLRDRRIGIKLGFIMFVPTLATVIVGANGLVSQISTETTADQTRALATLSADAGSLTDALQTERSEAILVLGNNEMNNAAVVSASSKTFNQQTLTTARLATEYLRQASSQTGLPDNLEATLTTIKLELGQLTSLHTGVTPVRNQTNQLLFIPLSLAEAQYTTLIGNLLSIRDSAAQLAGDQRLIFEMRAGSAISSMKEFLAQEQDVVLQSLIEKSMPPTAHQEYIAAKAGQDQALSLFSQVATPVQQAFLAQTVAGSTLKPSEHYESLIENLSDGAAPTGFTAADWSSAMTERAQQMRTVETNIDGQVIHDATALRDNVNRQIIVDVGLLFGLVLVAMLIAWFVARSMNRSLRELKHGALTVARYGLPQAVSRLRDPTLASQFSPAQIAAQIAEPLPVRSRDEFGEVTEAFNAVHLEAVRTAAEQAALRSSVATMFVNLARRSQILVDRLIGHLDRLERGEEDPDRLAELFQLDHLATRMRRNDENLLVLAGADSTRVQREPAPLMDVLRAAQSEVEHYTRIEFGAIDRDLEIGAHAVNDMVHLVAELFDNATAFSPPDSPVVVEARRVGDRAVLYVEDHGIGISADQIGELNERLANPPMVDVAVSRMMGLVVVARLATRHGVKVELRPAPDRGTVADVLLPTSVLIPRAVANRPTAMPDRALPGEPVRSPFAPPLALESGPSAAAGRGNRLATANGFGANGASSGSLGGFAASAETFGVDRPATFGQGGGGRGLPSWSDLTGANGGGGGGFGGPPSPASGRPPGVGATGFHGPGPSDGGVNGTGVNGGVNSRGTNGGGTSGGTNGAGTSGGGRNGSPNIGVNPALDFPTGPRAGAISPLPQRRGIDQWGDDQWPAGADDESDARPRIPRQRPQAPLDEASLLEDFAEAELVDDDYRHDEIDADEAIVARVDERTPPAAAPPVWPPVPPYSAPVAPPVAEPVAADSIGADEDHTNSFETTGSFRLGAGRVDALDMTAEIPAFRDLDLAGAARNDAVVDETAGSDPRAELAPYLSRPEPANVLPFTDETMELPIFRELESAWFAAVGPAPRESAQARPVDEVAAQSAVRLPTNADTYPPGVRETVASHPAATTAKAEYSPGPTTGGHPMSGSTTGSERVPDSNWRSAADEGWIAAAAASEPVDAGVTEGGLPRRVPMAQLVPGGVDKAQSGSNRRSPDAVRGLLSAYHRGVQRGRQQTTDDSSATPESMTTGSHSPGGKEQEV